MRRNVGTLERWTGSLLGAVLLAIVPSVHLSAQVADTARVVTTGASVVALDTTHRIRPMGAFWRSLLLPGWGQAETGRPVTGALFVAWERSEERRVGKECRSRWSPYH